MNVIKDEWVLQQKSDKGQAIDHMHIRKHFKQEAMQHFVAQLFVAAHSDYSITTQSSNVGKFIMEMTATAKRMTQVGEIGSLGTSLDCSFIEASTHCCNFKLKTTGPYKTPQERKCKVGSAPTSNGMHAISSVLALPSLLDRITTPPPFSKSPIE